MYRGQVIPVQQYQISQSPTLNIFNLSLYMLVILAILVFVDQILMAGLLALLSILLMISDYLQWKHLDLQALTDILLFPDSGIIEIQHQGRRQRFKCFSLYLNRWFLIVILRDQQQSKNFLLLADRFGSVTDYLNFRHQILKMSRVQYAT